MERFATIAVTTLAENINDSQTEFDVAAAPIASGTYRIIIDSEIMTVTGVATNTLTVIRGTSPAAHNNGAAVKHILTATGLTAHLQNDLVQVGTYESVPELPQGGNYLPRRGRYALTPCIGVLNTWVNQQTTTVDETKGYLKLTFPTNLRGTFLYGKEIGAITSFTALLSANRQNLASQTVGLCWYRSTKILTFGLSREAAITQLRVDYMATPTSTSISNKAARYCTLLSGLYWLRTSISGTTLSFDYSFDSVTWTTLTTLSSTTDLGGAPTHIGISGCSAALSLPAVNATVYHWAEA